MSNCRESGQQLPYSPTQSSLLLLFYKTRHDQRIASSFQNMLFWAWKYIAECSRVLNIILSIKNYKTNLKHFSQRSYTVTVTTVSPNYFHGFIVVFLYFFYPQDSHSSVTKIKAKLPLVMFSHFCYFLKK